MDRTLSPNQFDAPTLSIDSHRTSSGVKREIEKWINKKQDWEIEGSFVTSLCVHF